MMGSAIAGGEDQTVLDPLFSSFLVWPGFGARNRFLRTSMDPDPRTTVLLPNLVLGCVNLTSFQRVVWQAAARP
jgi:hypothetical protein